ncbi:hypothetical protein BKP45_14730 [Anaerobacillus alkalidiazotrophicus]|uniref:Uncharacterized protein n=1 Tax=Anaerobacillus alkalidiazotrophicus TaxID=472963 RepID=A0A1S2M2M6_9BACI|nr:hypothetical protein [Anaerobacillus alkalidiazotrophicus]OIJ18978.1 hypothetical protein BKP45_14730 [Anaerobacillus alkalidiazotrophicus]
MMGIKHYFLDGNTSQGYVSFVGDVVDDINRIFLIKGSVRVEKSKVLKNISEIFEKQNIDVHWLHNSTNDELLDGIIIPQLSIAVLDGSNKSGVESKYKNFVEVEFDIDVALDRVKLEVNKKAILKLIKDNDQFHKEAYAKFAKGKEIHEKKEELYISAMDFDKANKVIAQIAANLYHDVREETEKLIVKQLFFGAGTSRGPINYIENITEDIKKRYIIKGRSGSGKSTLMRRIAKYGENLGLSVQYFPCGLDPNSLDMIIIPTLSVAILDGTAPHIIDPTRETDEVIDMFELCMDQSVEDKYGKEFDLLHESYKEVMKEGTQLLQEAKHIGHLLDELYQNALDQMILKKEIDKILNTFKGLH